MGRMNAGDRRRLQEKAALEQLAARSPFWYGVIRPMFGKFLIPITLAGIGLFVAAVFLFDSDETPAATRVADTADTGGTGLGLIVWLVLGVAVAAVVVVGVRWLMVPPAARERARQARQAVHYQDDDD